MVLQVHGGPWARDRYGLNERNQFLANRGYAVLQVNYRGSTGYGKRFQQAALREFAGKMHDDLIDGVNWAVAQGVADKQNVCISGGSYGGYATLVGLTFTPDVFACGVDVVGMSNLVTLIKNVPAYWKHGMPYWYKYVGNPDKPEDKKDMESRSPLFKVNAVKKPLMIVQGANDPRVTQLESDQMVKALRDSGKEVEYLLFKDEGHGIRKWTNNLTYHRKMEDFLAKHLGGRSAGFDYYQLGTLIFNN
jgi:dipeptidyl aminopeptidase/acylaminoacyl peptidase